MVAVPTFYLLCSLDIPLKAGSLVRVPKGVLLQTHDVEEDL